MVALPPSMYLYFFNVHASPSCPLPNEGALSCAVRFAVVLRRNSITASSEMKNPKKYFNRAVDIALTVTTLSYFILPLIAYKYCK